MNLSQFTEFIEHEATDVLRLIVGDYKTPFESLPRKNLCDPVSNELAVRLEDEFGYTVRSPVYAPVNGAKHFIAVVTATSTETLEVPIVIDATIAQFGEPYPSLVVARLDSQEVREYYDYIDYPA